MTVGTRDGLDKVGRLLDGTAGVDSTDRTDGTAGTDASTGPPGRG